MLYRPVWLFACVLSSVHGSLGQEHTVSQMENKSIFSRENQICSGTGRYFSEKTPASQYRDQKILISGICMSLGWFHMHLNLVSPGRCSYDFECAIVKHNLGVDSLSIHANIILEWMPEDLVEGKSTLVQVMAWCHQAASHYLNQCRSRSLMPYVITRPHCH